MSKRYLIWNSDHLLPHQTYAADFLDMYVTLEESGRGDGHYELTVWPEDAHEGSDTPITADTIIADQFEYAFLVAESWLREWAVKVRKSLGPSEEQISLNHELCDIFKKWGTSKGQDITVEIGSNYRELIDYITAHLEKP